MTKDFNNEDRKMTIMDVIETFIDGHPDLEENNSTVEIGEVLRGTTSGDLTRRLVIDGRKFDVTVQLVL